MSEKQEKKYDKEKTAFHKQRKWEKVLNTRMIDIEKIQPCKDNKHNKTQRR